MSIVRLIQTAGWSCLLVSYLLIAHLVLGDVVVHKNWLCFGGAVFALAGGYFLRLADTIREEEVHMLRELRKRDK